LAGDPVFLLRILGETGFAQVLVPAADPGDTLGLLMEI